ncbi:MAG: PGF-pre-PGF domain-containing protein [Candidatus Aenigmatarchaeota archaeon]
MKYLLLALAVAAVMLVISVMQPQTSGHFMSPSECDHTSGDWVIDALIPGGTCTCSDDMPINMNGDNIIIDDATLDLGNCDVTFNCVPSGSCGVIVRNGGKLIMGAGSSISKVGENAFTFNVSGVSSGGSAVSNLTMTGATVSGAGFDGGHGKSGIYIGEGAIVSVNGSSRIIDGYDGIIINSSSGNDIVDSYVDGSSGDGIYLCNVTNTVIRNNSVWNSDGNGIVVNGTGAVLKTPQSGNGVSISDNDVYNNDYGIIIVDSNLTDGNVTGNYVHKNRDDGIRDLNPYGEFYMTFNTITNNSGYAVYTNVITGPNILAEVQNNIMCYNSRSVYWEGWNGVSVPFYYEAGFAVYAPANNQFCVNATITLPYKGGCTDNDEMSFYVDGNPWAEAIPGGSNLPYGGFTNCTLYIDGVDKDSNLIVGMSNYTSLYFNGTLLDRGSHTYNITCDPPLTDIIPNSGSVNGNWDIIDPESDYFHNKTGGGSGPGCDPNVNLAVHWLDGTCNITHVVLSTNETDIHRNYTDGSYNSPWPIEGNQLWSNFTWWNASMENKWINWLAWANDTAGRWTSTTNATFQAIPCTESIVTGLGGGMSYGKCSNVTLTIFWNSSVVNISYAWLGTNETGAWKNYTDGTYGSPVPITEGADHTDFTWWNQSVRGHKVFWKGCANESLGNVNCTEVASFTAVPCANATPVASGVCGTLRLRVTWEDTAMNQSTVFLSTNETGAWRNYTDGTYGSPAAITEGADYTDFSWWNASMINRAIGWKVYWNSSWGDLMESSNSSFTATPCTSVTPITGGGGGGGGAVSGCNAIPLNSGVEFSLPATEANSSRTCTDSGLVRRLDLIFGSKTQGYTQVTIRNSTIPLMGLGNPSENVYIWLNITSTVPDVADATLRFSVKNSWLDSANLSKASLYRWNSGDKRWESLSVTVVNSTGGETLHEAALNGFSIFVIGGGTACSCPASIKGACVAGMLNETLWTCGPSNGFTCVQSAVERPCCDCQQDAFSDCLDAKHIRTSYECNQGTDYVCVPKIAEEDCIPPFELSGDQIVLFISVAVVAAVVLFFLWRRGSFRRAAKVKTQTPKPAAKVSVPQAKVLPPPSPKKIAVSKAVPKPAKRVVNKMPAKATTKKSVAEKAIKANPTKKVSPAAGTKPMPPKKKLKSPES